MDNVKLKNVTLQLLSQDSQTSFILTEEDANKLVERFCGKSAEILSLENKDKDRLHGKIHIRLNQVGILEEEDFQGTTS